MNTICSKCQKNVEALEISIKRNIKRNNQFICHSCSSKANPRPQNKKDYWTTEKKVAHSLKIKNSDKYYEGIKNRNTSGIHNGMFGKKASVETKLKMSRSRTGKIGENATAWKGGKLSLTRKIKQAVHRKYNWYKNIYKRDNFKCTKCGTNKLKLDAHHIEPINQIIKRVCENKLFNTENEKYLFLVNHPDIVDSELKNGITLCRTCHKEIHNNWGSHNAR